MKKYIAIVIVIITCLSCQKEVLDKDPRYVTDLENYIVDQKTAEQALVGAYKAMQNYGFYQVGKLLSEISGSLIYPIAGMEEPETSQLKLSSKDNYVENVWAACFETVNNSNWVIGNVLGLSENQFQYPERKTEIIAEARFLRALGNSISLTAFGHWFNLGSEYGIPLREELATAYSNLEITRSTVKESYDFILEDLDFAIQNLRLFEELPDTSKSGYEYSKKAWACVSTAKALKARVLMNRGLEGDLDAVISLASDVIANTNYSMDNSSSVFSGVDSKESVLINFKNDALSPSPFQDYKYNESANNYRYNFGPVLRNFIDDTSYFKDLNDLRITYKSAEKAYYRFNSPNQIVIKFNDEPIQNYLYFIRLSELYLIRAEAYAKKNLITEAKNSLSKIWEQAGMSPDVSTVTTMGELMRIILREFYIELSAEFGQEWHFLVRNDLVYNYRSVKRLTGENFFVLPIPFNEIVFNNLMLQNPGYETN